MGNHSFVINFCKGENMRLFIAITFTEDIKEHLYKTINELRDIANSGNFTLKDNLHLTLNFIGETDHTQAVMQAMQQAVANVDGMRFQLTFEGLGKFKRREGDIYWVGIAKEPLLWRIQQEIARELWKMGFAIEDREFKPHITLGRKVSVDKDFQLGDFEKNFVPRTMDVTKVSLMKSERIQGKLTYTEIYHIDLM